MKIEIMETSMWWHHINRGFYDYPIEGGVEISHKYWLELLDGQSNGKNITSDENGYPILTDPVVSINDVRAMKLSELDNYDSSDKVNVFTLNGRSLWFDKATRASLSNNISIEETEKEQTTRLWFGNPPEYMDLPIEPVKRMLTQLEKYAKQTFEITQQHKADICKLTDIDALQSYDVSVGYPTPLTFEI